MEFQNSALLAHVLRACFKKEARLLFAEDKHRLEIRMLCQEFSYLRIEHCPYN